MQALRASTYLSQQLIWFTSMAVNIKNKQKNKAKQKIPKLILVAAPEGATYTVLSQASAKLTLRLEMQKY